MKAALTEVQSRILGLKRHKRPAAFQGKSYVGRNQSSLIYLDNIIPDVRRAYKLGYSFSNFTPKKQWPIWDHVFQNARYFEVRSQALYYAAHHSVEDLHARRRFFLTWVHSIDNWAHSDEYSSHLAKLVERYPKVYLPILEKWSRSKAPWLRRQSLVSLFYYARARQTHVPFSLVKRRLILLIEDEDFYVQRGVGWMLRESYNVYPQETAKLIATHASRLSSIAFSTATEKMDKALKRKTALTRAR